VGRVVGRVRVGRAVGVMGRQWSRRVDGFGFSRGLRVEGLGFRQRLRRILSGFEV
jgi:hypothetical protein